MLIDRNSKNEFVLNCFRELLDDGEPHRYREIIDYVREQAKGTQYEGTIEQNNLVLPISKKLEDPAFPYFAKAKTLFEDSKYHNCVFVGTDEQGIPRHAHKRSANSLGKSFRQNVEGSDPRYSFHHLGTDGKLFVFEAPIDMLSFITLYPEDWKSHNYVSCCGTSTIPVMSMLSRIPHAQEVFLCLDNDAAGQAASIRMAEQIAEQFGIASDRLAPQNKDWNDDLCVLEDTQVPFLEMG